MLQENTELTTNLLTLKKPLVIRTEKSTTEKFDFVYMLGIIIDDLLSETEFNNDFFLRFDKYHSEICKSNNISICAVFNEIYHIFQQRNAEGFIFKKEEKRIAKYRKILNDLKNNSISETQDISNISNYIEDQLNGKNDIYTGVSIEIKSVGNLSGKVNTFFLNLILDNILSNYQRYGKNGTLMIIFKENCFDIEFNNEIREFNTEIYNKFKTDFPGDELREFYMPLYSKIEQIEGFNDWIEEKGVAVNDYNNNIVIISLLEEFYDIFYVNYNGNVNFSKKDLVNRYLRGEQKLIENYEIGFKWANTINKNKDKKFLILALKECFHYIFSNGNKPKGTGKGNGIIKQIVEDIFWGKLDIINDGNQYITKITGLNYF